MRKGVIEQNEEEETERIIIQEMIEEILFPPRKTISKKILNLIIRYFHS
jgi:uncharacterized membrane-anchored protein